MLAQLGALGDVTEPIKVDVGAADHGHILPRAIPLAALGIFLEPGDGQGASRFGDQARVVEHILDGGADFIDRDDDHPVDTGPGDLERLPSNLRHGYAIREQVQGVEWQADTSTRAERC